MTLDQLENLVDAKQIHPDFILKIVGSNQTVSSILNGIKEVGKEAQNGQISNGLITLVFILSIFVIFIIFLGLIAICTKNYREKINKKLYEIRNKFFFNNLIRSLQIS